MRPGQKNRMRGGGGRSSNTSRRGPNPLTRSYESNGPDVKVRGTPQHIAEKYVQLARDAHSAGDTVMAEGYLQHAEHYYRIIAAAMAVQQQAYNQSIGVVTPNTDEQDDEDEFEVAGTDRFTFRTPQSFQPGAQPGAQPGSNGNGNGNYGGQPYGPGGYGEGGDQPIVDGMPQPEGGPAPYQQGGQQRGDRPQGQRRPYEERGPRRFGRDRGERPPGEPRNPEYRNAEPRTQEPRIQEPRTQESRTHEPRTQEPRTHEPRTYELRANESRGEAPSRDLAEIEQPGLPAFITAPVPRVIVAEEAPVIAGGGSVEGEAPVRARRRRRPRAEEAAGETEDLG